MNPNPTPTARASDGAVGRPTERPGLSTAPRRGLPATSQDATSPAATPRFVAPAALRRLAAVLLSLAAALPAAAQPVGEWRYFGGEAAFTCYSPLDQIDRENVGGLEIVWRRPGLDPAVQEAFPRPAGQRLICGRRR